MAALKSRLAVQSTHKPEKGVHATRLVISLKIFHTLEEFDEGMFLTPPYSRDYAQHSLTYPAQKTIRK